MFEYVEEDHGHATPCWIWGGATMTNGYGYWRHTSAHRAVYAELRGPVPDGLEIDHLCRVRLCVNPDHLEPVTHKENVRRSRVTKLSWPEVREIRGSSESQRALAARYGVDQAHISLIRRGGVWREEATSPPITHAVLRDRSLHRAPRDDRYLKPRYHAAADSGMTVTACGKAADPTTAVAIADSDPALRCGQPGCRRAWSIA